LNITDKHRTALLEISKILSVNKQGVPKNEKGEPTETFLEYLSLMYNEEEAELIKHLPIFPKGSMTARKLAKKLDMDKKELKAKLNKIADKGFIMRAGGFSLPNPLLVYDAPFILKQHYDGPHGKRFAELSRHFFEKEGYYKQWETSIKGTPRSRILTVSEKIETGKDIIPAEEVYKIIDKYEKFALVPCPCRKRAEVEGVRKCTDKYPMMNCLILGGMAEGVLAFNDPVNKEIPREEAKKLTREASELGLVHTTDNYAKESAIICACCECCCGLLAGLTRSGLNNPKSIAVANFIANVNEEACIACGTCVDRCKFSAINVEDKAIINEEKCMGCGLCAVTCPEDAIVMKRLERVQIPGS